MTTKRKKTMIKWKYNVGAKCIIQSRYEGLIEVTVTSLVDYWGEPSYELDQLVQIDKDGNRVGSRELVEHEEEYIFASSSDIPCPEHLLTPVE